SVLKLLHRKIGQIETIEFLSKRPLRHLRHLKCLRLSFKLLQQIHNFSERYFMGNMDTAVATILCDYCLHAIKLTADFLPLQQIEQSLYQIVNVQKLQLCGSVVHSERFIVSHSPAEGRYSGIVLRPAVSHQVWKTV